MFNAYKCKLFANVYACACRGRIERLKEQLARARFILANRSCRVSHSLSVLLCGPSSPFFLFFFFLSLRRFTFFVLIFSLSFSLLSLYSTVLRSSVFLSSALSLSLYLPDYFADYLFSYINHFWFSFINKSNQISFIFALLIHLRRLTVSKLF